MNRYTQEIRPTKLLTPLVAFILMVCCGTWLGEWRVTSAQTNTSKTHILLLDTSGSMKSRYDPRYGGGLKNWLIRPMIQSGVFAANDEVIVRKFHTGGSEVFNQNDELRKLSKTKYDEGQVLSSIPGSVDNKDTDIPKALRLALADVRGYDIKGDILIWLITDNIQDAGGDKDVTPLYETLTKNESFKGVYLYPLLNDPSLGAPADQSCDKKSDKPCAMMMYFMHYAEREQVLNHQQLEELALKVGQKINNPAIHWLPFDETFDLAPQVAVEITGDEASGDGGDGISVEAEPKPFRISEGETTQVSVPINIELRGSRRSVSGRIVTPKFYVDLPSAVRLDDAPTEQVQTGQEAEAASDETSETNEVVTTAKSWTATITPQDISISPTKKVSAHNIEAQVPSALRGTNFLKALLHGKSEPFTGTLQFNLDNLRTEVSLDSAALDRVANSEGIQRIFKQNVRSDKAFKIEVPLIVEFNRGWRGAIVGVLAALLLGGAVGITSIFLVKSRYELITPSGERALALPLIGSQSVMLNGTRAATISKKFGSLSVTPHSGFTIGGTRTPRPLAGEGEFVLESAEDGRRYPHTLRSAAKTATVTVKRDDFLE